MNAVRLQCSRGIGFRRDGEVLACLRWLLSWSGAPKQSGCTALAKDAEQCDSRFAQAIAATVEALLTLNDDKAKQVLVALLYSLEHLSSPDCTGRSTRPRHGPGEEHVGTHALRVAIFEALVRSDAAEIMGLVGRSLIPLLLNPLLEFGYSPFHTTLQHGAQGVLTFLTSAELKAWSTGAETKICAPVNFLSKAGLPPLLALLVDDQLAPTRVIRLLRTLLCGGADVEVRSSGGRCWEAFLVPERHSPEVCSLLLESCTPALGRIVYKQQYELACVLALGFLTGDGSQLLGRGLQVDQCIPSLCAQLEEL